MLNKENGTIKLKLVKSAIRKPEDQKRTLIGLGLTKMNKEVVLEDTNSIRGMVRKVAHLVKVI
jgi:large subunit ribosomal protein L30